MANTVTGKTEIRKVNVASYVAWKNREIVFENERLDRIMDEVARWYDVEVFYVNAGVQGIVYNGKMPMYSGIGDVLRKFELSGEVRFELNGRTLTVYEK